MTVTVHSIAVAPSGALDVTLLRDGKTEQPLVLLPNRPIPAGMPKAVMDKIEEVWTPEGRAQFLAWEAAQRPTVAQRAEAIEARGNDVAAVAVRIAVRDHTGGMATANYQVAWPARVAAAQAFVDGEANAAQTLQITSAATLSGQLPGTYAQSVLDDDAALQAALLAIETARLTFVAAMAVANDQAAIEAAYAVLKAALAAV